MTWEETINYIRTKPEFKLLVEKAYLDENLQLNVKRFGESEEFKATLKLINRYSPNAKTILDIGSGNGVSAVNFALLNYNVTVSEPDSSKTIGAGAINQLKKELRLNNLKVYMDFAENLNFKESTFDIVYVRQAMHHANDLEKFVKECVRVLKPNGLLITVRDHVIFNDKDKARFLKAHPLHEFYGGENAFKPEDYKNAIKKAGAIIVKELKYFESPINYFPMTEEDVRNLKNKQIKKAKNKIKNKIGILSKLPFVWNIYKFVYKFNPLNEELIAGRMYSYIALKK